MSQFIRTVPTDIQLRQELKSWTDQAVRYIEGDLDAMAVVVNLTASHGELPDKIASATSIDPTTVAAVIDRLRTLGVVRDVRDSTGVRSIQYSLTLRGSGLVDKRLARWSRIVEERPIRKELAGFTSDELARQLLAITLKLHLELPTRTDLSKRALKEEQRKLEFRAGVIRQVQAEREGKNSAG